MTSPIRPRPRAWAIAVAIVVAVGAGGSPEGAVAAASTAPVAVDAVPDGPPPDPDAATVSIGGGRPGRSYARPPAVAPVGGRVVRAFDPPTVAYGPGHRNVDLAGRPGERVRAAMAGTVRFAGAVAGTTWVTIDHPGGLATTYGGLVASVAAGDRIALGAPLGRATGRGYVDWGARWRGTYIDPLGLLGGWRVALVPVP